MEGRFCVVGGDGFIGSSLVKSLLNRGFSVHATILPASGMHVTAIFQKIMFMIRIHGINKTFNCVRFTGNEDMCYLQRIPGAHERLKLFNADLRVEGSFDSPILGCQGVFFVAFPVDLGSEDPEVEIAS